jgi:hypothetical protein
VVVGLAPIFMLVNKNFHVAFEQLHHVKIKILGFETLALKGSHGDGFYKREV